MDNSEKIRQLETLKGQLNKIENVLEDNLESDDFFDLCDSTGTVGAYIKKVIQKLKREEL